jgi:hypothetical protein
VEDSCTREVFSRFQGLPDGALAQSPADVPPWPKLLRENSAGNRKTSAPMFVVQGSADSLIIQPLTEGFVQKACERGNTLEYRVYEGEDHGTSLFAARDDILAFFAARLAGDAPVSSCGGAVEPG